MAHQSFFWSSEEMFNIKSLEIAQTAKNIWNFIVIKSNLQEIANFGDYPGETVQNQESPGLSGRVDSTDLNLPHYSANICFCKNSRNSQQKFSVPKTFWVIYVQKFNGFLAPPLMYSNGQQKSGQPVETFLLLLFFVTLFLQKKQLKCKVFDEFMYCISNNSLKLAPLPSLLPSTTPPPPPPKWRGRVTARG